MAVKEGIYELFNNDSFPSALPDIYNSGVVFGSEFVSLNTYKVTTDKDSVSIHLPEGEGVNIIVYDVYTDNILSVLYTESDIEINTNTFRYGFVSMELDNGISVIKTMHPIKIEYYYDSQYDSQDACYYHLVIISDTSKREDS